jgi:uncharacterized protein YbjT (DUF2867 family)
VFEPIVFEEQMMSEKTLVLGASGNVGARVVALLQRAGHGVIGATRQPVHDAQVRFDLLDRATHAAALDGVGTVMLMARPGDEEAHLHAAPFIEAMRAARVHRVVVLSALGAGLRPEFSMRKLERLVEQSGLAWTHVRPNFFMQMLALPPLSTETAERGTLSLPLADARVAYVDAQDVAAVLCKALIDERLAGQAFEVSGPEALDHRTIATRIAGCTGTPVQYVALDEAAAATLLRSRGFAPAQLERVLTFYRLIREGFCSRVDTTSARLIGRPLARWDTFMASRAHVWRPDPLSA